MSTLSAALSLAAKGCRVFPIDAGTKKPAITGWPERATTDAARIRRWWSRWPAANVGIHTRGLLVIDIDGPIGHENLGRLRQQFPVPETLRIDSGNTTEPDHYQLVYALPGGLRAWNKPLAKFPGFESYGKIDIKSTRGQVLGPGSRHASGGTYRWATEPASVPDEATPAPGWMLAALCTADATAGPEGPAVGSDEELIDVLVNRFPVSGAGQRNNRMTAVVGWLVGKGLDRERVIRLATAWVRRFAGVYRSPLDRAEWEILGLVHRTFRNLATGRFARMTDHQERAAAEGLRPAVRQWFLSFATPGNTGTDPESTERSVLSPRSRLSRDEFRFLHCLLVHCQYEIATKGFSQRVLMTDRQLITIYKRLHGQQLNWRAFYTLKRKFISRPGRDGAVHRATRQRCGGRAGSADRMGQGWIPSAATASGLDPAARPPGRVGRGSTICPDPEVLAGSSTLMHSGSGPPGPGRQSPHPHAGLPGPPPSRSLGIFNRLQCAARPVSLDGPAVRVGEGCTSKYPASQTHQWFGGVAVESGGEPSRGPMHAAVPETVRASGASRPPWSLDSCRRARSDRPALIGCTARINFKLDHGGCMMSEPTDRGQPPTRGYSRWIGVICGLVALVLLARGVYLWQRSTDAATPNYSPTYVPPSDLISEWEKAQPTHKESLEDIYRKARDNPNPQATQPERRKPTEWYTTGQGDRKR